MPSASIGRLFAALVLTVGAAAGSAPGQGACCLPDVSCQEVASQGACEAIGGAYLPGATCFAGQCEPAACCHDMSCATADGWTCIVNGRDYAGGGITCLDDPCDSGVGACCMGGACLDIGPDPCTGSGGTWLGAGTNCDQGTCVLGACCLPGECVQAALFECNALGGIFIQAGNCAFTPCDVALHCPADSFYSQDRDDPDAFTAFTSESGAGLLRFDSYSGAAGSITGLRWWGLDLIFEDGDFVECAERDPTFQITFHEDVAGAPGDAVCSYTLLASRFPTNILYLGAQLNEYSVTLPDACILVDGWISIVGLGDPDCLFLWMSSPDGDGTSLCDGCIQTIQLRDLSFCILGTAGNVFGACCDQSTGACVDDAEIVDCIGPGLRFVPDTDCVDLDPPCAVSPGACCFGDGTCMVQVATSCDAAGGTWFGPGSTCDQCPPIGACCIADVDCFLSTEPACVSRGLNWLGEGTTCDACPEVPVCPGDTLLGQNPSGPTDFEAGSAEVGSPFTRWDDFSGLDGAIEAVTWWGVDLDPIEGTNNFVECLDPDPTFEIAFHADAGGVPGAALCSYTVLATRTEVGLTYLGTPLYEYTAALPQPCVLVNGWISIGGLGDPECWFIWMNSPDGNSISWCTGCGLSDPGIDFAFCLQGTSGGVFGACCNDATGACAEGVEIVDCIGPDLRFAPGEACDDLEPPCGVILGACCFDDATCTVLEQAACAAAGGDWLGASTLCAQCPCLVPCPAGAVVEGEPRCAPEYVDAFNGGCASDPPIFSTLDFGQTICGESGVFTVGLELTGDFDWYAVTLVRDTDIVWTTEAEFPAQILIFDATGGCPGQLLAAGGSEACDPLTASGLLESGDYWFVIGPFGASDEAQCGTPYRTTLLEQSTCPADIDGSGVVNVDDLVAVIIAWGSAGGAADVNDDGSVNVDDLVAVILAWGACPAAASAPLHVGVEAGAPSFGTRSGAAVEAMGTGGR